MSGADEIQDEFEAALALAEVLKAKGPEHQKMYDFYKAQTERYPLWPEVCWSANLRADMTAEEFGAALSHGCDEWDI